MIDVKLRLVCIVSICLVRIKVLSSKIEVKLIVILISICCIMINIILNEKRLLKFVCGNIGIVINVIIIVKFSLICVGMFFVLRLVIIMIIEFIWINGSRKLLSYWIMIVNGNFI